MTATVAAGAVATEPVDDDGPARTARYLDDTVRVWLGATRDVRVPPLPESLARLLLRLEEHERPARDRWGCWDFSFSENFQRGCLHEPEIERWVAERAAELPRATVLEPRWPTGTDFAVCLTHDVDLISDRYTVAQTARFVRGGVAPGVRSRAEPLARLARPGVRAVRSLRAGVSTTPTASGLERGVAAEADRGVSASYFFTVPPNGWWSRYDCIYSTSDPCRFRGLRVRVGEVLTTLAGEGFDVGLHGSYRAAHEAGALEAQRRVLELATGLVVTTTRQHFLRWDVRTSPPLQDAAGFSADSSLGFNRGVGFRAGTSLPYHLFDPVAARPLNLLEVPLVIQDSPLAGPTEDFGRARDVIGTFIDRVAGVGGAITFLFHPDKFVHPEWLALYEWTIDQALARRAWVTSLRQLDEWWRAREARILA